MCLDPHYLHVIAPAGPFASVPCTFISRLCPKLLADDTRLRSRALFTVLLSEKTRRGCSARIVSHVHLYPARQI